MAIIRNTAGQGLYIYAHDIANDEPETGDAANITATISLDGAAPGPLTDVNPTEIAGGVYWFGLTQAEANAAALALVATSTTADVQIDPVLVLTQEVGINTRAVAGDAMALTGAERTTLADTVDTTLSDTHGSGSWESAGGGDYTAVLAAIKAKTDRIGTGTATLVAPVTRSGQVRVIQGDAYYNTDSGRALDWSDDTWNVAESSTVVVVLHGITTFVAERLSATQIRLELSSADTLALPVGNAVFSVQEITAEGNTLSRVPYGAWNTAAQPTPVYTP